MRAETSSDSIVTLNRGFDDEGQYVWSPFVTKIELRFRIAGLQYHTTVGSPMKAPKGKVPYITFENGESLGDSSIIIKTLIENGLIEDLNSHVSPQAAAFDYAIRALFEEKLYFYMGPEKWIKNFYTMRAKILRGLSYPLQIIVGWMIYRKMTQILDGQGTLRHSDEEIDDFKLEIWTNLNNLLESSKAKLASRSDPFWIIGGNDPTEADMTVFGFIASTLVSDATPSSKEQIKKFPTIMDYANRIHNVYFQDYKGWKESSLSKDE